VAALSACGSAFDHQPICRPANGSGVNSYGTDQQGRRE
jgi:hypothetical protein